MINDAEATERELGFKIKVLNSLTGEISEMNVESATRAAELLVEFKASYKAIEHAIKTIQNHLDLWLGIDNELHLANGMRVKRIQRERREWVFDELRKYLDEDQVSLVTSIKKTEAKNMLAELIERGHVDPGAIKHMDETADVKGNAPFIEVK